MRENLALKNPIADKESPAGVVSISRKYKPQRDCSVGKFKIIASKFMSVYLYDISLFVSVEHRFHSESQEILQRTPSHEEFAMEGLYSNFPITHGRF